MRNHLSKPLSEERGRSCFGQIILFNSLKHIPEAIWVQRHNSTEMTGWSAAPQQALFGPIENTGIVKGHIHSAMAKADTFLLPSNFSSPPGTFSRWARQRPKGVKEKSAPTQSSSNSDPQKWVNVCTYGHVPVWTGHTGSYRAYT